MKYIGLVIDRMDDDVMHQTRKYTTWEEAQHAAEMAAKKKGLYYSDRYAIRVEED